jgi:hypothetical protein
MIKPPLLPPMIWLLLPLPMIQQLQQPLLAAVFEVLASSTVAAAAAPSITAVNAAPPSAVGVNFAITAVVTAAPTAAASAGLFDAEDVVPVYDLFT